MTASKTKTTKLVHYYFMTKGIKLFVLKSFFSSKSSRSPLIFKGMVCEVFYETRPPRGVETPVERWSLQQTTETIHKQFYQWKA
jgi:hypothetical protein